MCMNEKVFPYHNVLENGIGVSLVYLRRGQHGRITFECNKKRKMQSGQVSYEVPSMSTSGESRTNQSEVAVVFMSQNPRIPNQTV